MSQNYMPGDSERQRKKYKATLAVLLSICLFLLVVCACLLTALVLIGKHLVRNSSPSKSQSRPTVDQLLARLPRDAVPIHYDLTLKPDLEAGDYQGFVNITVNVTRIRKEIFLHSKNLSIDKVQLSRANDSKVFHIGNVQENAQNEFIVILPKERLSEGVYHVSVNFSGNMINKLSGFYRSKVHINSDEKPRYMATSKFEPTYARQAFPCFDEPNMKATYTVHLLRPNDAKYIALSNYPHNKEETVPEGTMVHFDKTVPMSTYLACFIVSDFVATNTTFLNDGKEIPFKVFATPEQLDKTTYAGEVGKKVIEYYIDYFNIPYPLPKLDMVAIPDFVSGAMEHWGLVTFRETALLYTPKTHSSANKQRVATVVAHELAHSWFGNLVTMDWWNNLWLNEGFASYIEYKGVHHAEPDWGMLDQFLIEDLHAVLALDATKASHPIITTVETPDQITEVFDTISYNKGAAVLRMLEYVVGPENFRSGVTNYLNKHKFGNAITQNLWDELQAVVGNSINITSFMDTYTVQMGYPILDVKVDGSKYTLTQKRFLTDPETVSNPNDSPYKYKWSVPVSYITDKGESDISWFDHNSDQLIINKPADSLFLKFNPGQVGYYRVNYPETEWRSFFNAMKDGTLEASDRTHLLEESFSTAESGVLSYAVPLDLTKYLITEMEYTPWSVASSKLDALKTRLQDSQYEGDFRNYVIKILKPAYENLTWNESADELHLRKRARVVVLALACSIGHKDALAEAKARFDSWINTNQSEPLSPDLRSIIYKYGAVNADEATWNKLFDVFNKESDANEKIKLMVALASVQNPALLKKLIELAKDEQYIRSQDYFSLLSYIADNTVGTPIVWDYVREHWIDVLVKRFTLNSRLLGRLIPTITRQFSSQVKMDELKQFFEKYPEAGAGAAARVQALDRLSTNIKWLNKYKKAVEDWIVKNK